MLASVSVRWYATALRHELTMLVPPSATAVAVGMAISSTSRERTRQFLSSRPGAVPDRSSAPPAWPRPGPPAASSAGPPTTEPPFTGLLPTRPTAPPGGCSYSAAAASARYCCAEPGEASRLFFRDGTVGVPLTWSAGGVGDRPGSPELALTNPSWETNLGAGASLRYLRATLSLTCPTCRYNGRLPVNHGSSEFALPPDMARVLSAASSLF